MSDEYIYNRLRKLESRIRCICKGGVSIFATTSTIPADPAIGTSIEWFDGTNKRYKKNVNGVITTGIIY